MNIYFGINELLENSSSPILIPKEKFDKLTTKQKKELLNNEYVRNNLNSAATIAGGGILGAIAAGAMGGYGQAAIVSGIAGYVYANKIKRAKEIQNNHTDIYLNYNRKWEKFNKKLNIEY